MPAPNSFQSKSLRGLAHRLKPVVLVGPKGISASVLYRPHPDPEKRQRLMPAERT